MHTFQCGRDCSDPDDKLHMAMVSLVIHTMLDRIGFSQPSQARVRAQFVMTSTLYTLYLGLDRQVDNVFLTSKLEAFPFQ